MAPDCGRSSRLVWRRSPWSRYVLCIWHWFAVLTMHRAGRQHLGAFFNLIAYYVIALPLGITLAFHQRTHLGLQGLWIGTYGEHSTEDDTLTASQGKSSRCLSSASVNMVWSGSVPTGRGKCSVVLNGIVRRRRDDKNVILDTGRLERAETWEDDTPLSPEVARSCMIVVVMHVDCL